jgi:uncharacterized protein YbjT (DUF2867 family)
MVLVCGITGQIGGEVARLLNEAGQEVCGLTRDVAKARRRLGKGIRLVEADFSRPETLPSALAGAEKAFFVADAGPELGGWAANFSAAAKAAGVRHVVAVSSATIDIQPPVAIGLWHLALERSLQASGLTATLLRPGNFASNALGWAHMIASQGAVFSAFDGKSTPIDPRDIARVAFTALTAPGHGGKTYTLTGPTILSVRQQVEILSQVLAKPIRFVPVPEAGARQGMVGSGMPEAMADAILELVRASARGPVEPPSPAVREVTGADARTFDVWVRDNALAFA